MGQRTAQNFGFEYSGNSEIAGEHGFSGHLFDAVDAWSGSADYHEGSTSTLKLEPAIPNECEESKKDFSLRLEMT
jgi:hypothetical protein